MIQFLCVNKVSSVTDPGALPGNFMSIEELAAADIAPQNKVKVFVTQAFLARYIAEMNSGAAPSMEQYLQRMLRLVPTSIPENTNTMSSDLYQRYVSIMSALLHGKPIVDYTGLTMILGDCTTCDPNFQMLEEDFYVPYLKTMLKDKRERYNGALLMVPILQNIKSGGHSVVFVPKRFASCDLQASATFSNTPALEYLHRLDWTGQNWKQFVATLQSFYVEPYATYDAPKTLAGALNSILRNRDTSMVDTRGARNEFLRSFQLLQSRYRMDVDSLESLGFILSGFGYDASFLLKANPLTTDMVAFEKYAELSFLKPYKLRAAMEAAAAEEDKPDDDENEDDDQGTPDADPLPDDPDTDPDSDDGEDPSEDPSADDAGSDDLGSDTGDDFGGDDGLGDESGTDSGDSGSGDGANQLTDTVKEPEDPTAIIFKIVTAETFSDFMFRKAATNALVNLVNNPPSSMSNETVAFLRMWISDWIDIVDADTTKSVLRQFAVEIDV